MPLRLIALSIVLCCIVLLTEFSSGQLGDDNAFAATDCGSNNSSKVDNITEAFQSAVFTDKFTVTWRAPANPSTRILFYILECTGCPVGQVNVSGVRSHQFTNLTPATEYSVSVRAGLFDCELSNPFDLVGRTILSGLQGVVSFTEVTETSFRASWSASPDAGVNYMVSCAGRTSQTFAVCQDQISGSQVTVTVRPVKDGFPEGRYIDGKVLTKLFAIDSSSAQIVSTTTTSITVSWAASQTRDVSYVLSCKRGSDGLGAGRNATETTGLTATCESLESGHSYKVTVTVRKSGGFDDAVAELPGTLLTKLFPIESSQVTASLESIKVTWRPSRTSNFSYILTCVRPDDGAITEASTTAASAECGSLLSGRAYNLTIAVTKPGGFEDAVSNLGTHLTKLYPIDLSTIRYSVTATNITVSWSPSNTFDVFYVLKCTGSTGSGGEISDTTSEPRAVCDSLNSGQAYSISLTVSKSGGFDDIVANLGTRNTKLSAIGSSSVIFTVNETSINLAWSPSSTSGVTYEVTCRWEDGTGTSSSVPTPETRASFSLPSGLAVRFTITVKKSGGFEDAVTDLGLQWTKLFGIGIDSVNYSKTQNVITVSWRASQTPGVFYALVCKQSDGQGTKTVDTTDLRATCDSLEYGQIYELTLAVKKIGGFSEVVTNLQMQLTQPFLSTQQGSFIADVSILASNSSSTDTQLTVKWTAESVRGADLIMMRVTPELSSEVHALNTSLPAYEVKFRMTLPYAETLRVSLIALVQKLGLTEQSQENSITLHTAPYHPSISELRTGKRSINLTITPAVSRLGSGHANLNGTAQTCSPSDPRGSCNVTFLSLKPYTLHALEVWAEFHGLRSSSWRLTYRTKEDAPTQPVDVRAILTSRGMMNLTWREPWEKNGVLTGYIVYFGVLDFASSSEILYQVRNTNDTQISQQNLQPGFAYYWYVTACTEGGCSESRDRVTFLMDDAVPSSVTSIVASASDTRVEINWQSLNHSQGIVFEYVIQVARHSTSGCLTGHIVNCTDCRRSRENVTQDGKSQLDSLTNSCSNVQSVSRFSYSDSRVSVSMDVGNSSSNNSTNLLLQAWTKYTVKVWPVNRAGPGAVQSMDFQTPEAPSGSVENLRATPVSKESVVVEFAEPMVKNGLLLAYAVQIYSSGRSEGPCSLVVINVTSAHCQLVKCATWQIIDKLASDCGNQTTVLHLAAESSPGPDGRLQVKAQINQLQDQVGYSLRVTPVSQTRSGLSSESAFCLGDCANRSWVIIVVSVVVPIVVVAIVAILIAICRRRTDSSSDTEKERSAVNPRRKRSTGNGMDNAGATIELRYSLPPRTSDPQKNETPFVSRSSGDQATADGVSLRVTGYKLPPKPVSPVQENFYDTVGPRVVPRQEAIGDKAEGQVPEQGAEVYDVVQPRVVIRQATEDKAEDEVPEEEEEGVYDIVQAPKSATAFRPQMQVEEAEEVYDEVRIGQ